jgi:hypothetical protein
MALVSGGVIGVFYYIFGAPLIEGRTYKKYVDIAVLVIAILLAFYSVWRNQQKKIKKLEDKLRGEQDKKPRYSLEVIDCKSQLDKKIKAIEKRISDARVSRDKAPSPNPFMPSISLISGVSTKDDWDGYIERLTKYRSELDDIKKNKKYKVINFVLNNSGHADTNINIELEFVGFKQIVDFYENNVIIEEPHKPTNGLMTFSPSIGSLNKLGINREVHTNKPNLIDVEIDRLRNNESVRLHYYPIFVANSTKESVVNYKIRSDLLNKEASGNIALID